MSSKKRTYNLADLFQIVVETKPDDEALVCGDHRLTYRQLDDRSTKLALWLKAKGVGTGETERKIQEETQATIRCIAWCR